MGVVAMAAITAGTLGSLAAGAVLVAVGLATVVAVTVQNNYASTTVAVEAGQQVVSTGLYGVVRHPMYTANAIMLVGLAILMPRAASMEKSASRVLPMAGR